MALRSNYCVLYFLHNPSDVKDTPFTLSFAQISKTFFGPKDQEMKGSSNFHQLTTTIIFYRIEWAGMELPAFVEGIKIEMIFMPGLSADMK